MKDSIPARSLIDRLRREPHRFSFFQAVRILEAWGASQAEPSRTSDEETTSAAGRPIGYDEHPAQEVVRFRSLPSQAFPGCDLSAASVRSPAENTDLPSMELVVTFLGLFGPTGALPQHYTQLVVDRLKHHDPTLRNFLDLFNHRLIALFYRAWAKYRLPVAFEQHQRGEQATDDPITRTLYSLVGLGTGGLRGRLKIPDALFIHFGGHFAHYPRHATGLQQILTAYYRVATEVCQFQGQWLSLEPNDQSRLGNHYPLGANDQLGVNAVVGQRVWSVENRFRLRLGPMDYAQFQQLMPDGETLESLSQLTRMYAGPEFDFDVQLVLRNDEVPASRLPKHDEPPHCRLGWNSWIQSQPRKNDAADAVFVCEGLPS